MGLRGKDRWDQLVAVNRYANARPYVSDARNWGYDDYWETPSEFLSRSGDCEDYAIVKYFALRQLGWSDDQLRLMVVRDLNHKTTHVVLAVFHQNRAWLLDNQLDAIVAADRVRHYQPLLSFNQAFLWRHWREVVASTASQGRPPSFLGDTSGVQ